MKPRALARVIHKALKTFPAIVVTGPRQSGKTTLLRMLFSKTHRFVSLEDPDVRIRAKEDPLHFLDQYSPPVMIDESSMCRNCSPISKAGSTKNGNPASGCSQDRKISF
jgi:predicted AAA+ superfamily ATPase